MNKLYLLLCAIFLLYACTEQDISQFEDTELQFADQKWQLVRMSGSMVNSTTVGSDMEWQEYYIFSLDGSFQKYRETNGTITRARGTFVATEYENDTEDYLELTYTEGLSLVGNCSGDQKEVLIYRSSREISNTWMACDGPGLDYVLVED